MATGEASLRARLRSSVRLWQEGQLRQKGAKVKPEPRRVTATAPVCRPDEEPQQAAKDPNSPLRLSLQALEVRAPSQLSD